MKFINKNFSAIKSNFLRDVKTDNILIPTVISFGKRNCKYVIGYMDDDYKTKPLNILLPKTSTYVKSMMVKLNGCFILLFYDDTWNKVSHRIKKRDIEPIYNKKSLITKIKSDADKATDFCDKKLLKQVLIIFV